jgi:hypothetical protein
MIKVHERDKQALTAYYWASTIFIIVLFGTMLMVVEAQLPILGLVLLLLLIVKWTVVTLYQIPSLWQPRITNRGGMKILEVVRPEGEKDGMKPQWLLPEHP